jgi:acyl carrier protein
MTDQEILNTLERILRDLLFDDSIVLMLDTRRDDVNNWDSLAYITFLVAVELHFGIKFRVADVEAFPNVGAIVRTISALLPLRFSPLA